MICQNPKANGPAFIYWFLRARHFKNMIPLPTEVSESISDIL